METITAFIHGVFACCCVLKYINHSLICLIPKVEHPEYISQFTLICISNVIIKVVLKVISNRLKSLMNDLVGPNQASFICGRLNSNNIVIAQELLYSLRGKKDTKGSMIVKIDLEKTYNRVVCFDDDLVWVILNCIKSTQLLVIWKGEILDNFKPESSSTIPFCFVYGGPSP